MSSAPLLTPGDVVAVVTPAFAVRADLLEAGVAALRRMRLRVRLGAHVLEQKGYLGGTDQERLHDLQRALSDPEVRGVWFSRGGYGTGRLLEELDLAPLRRAPKVLVGHSDVTALFSAVSMVRRCACLHGPFVAELGRRESFHRPSLRAALAGGPVRMRFAHRQVLGAGVARGRLRGGNLTVLAHLLGTEYQPDFRRAVVLLEDVGEETYRLDRLLLHLRMSGVLDRAAAVLLGSFDPPPTRRAFPPDRPLDEVLREHLMPLGVPVVAGLPLGHLRGKWTVPLGGMATVDTAAGTIEVAPPSRA